MTHPFGWDCHTPFFTFQILTSLSLLMVHSSTVVRAELKTEALDRVRRDENNFESVNELWSTFARTTLVICKPDSAQLQCPPRMHIRPLTTTALSNEQLLHLKRTDNVSPQCFRKETSRFVKDLKQLDELLHKCRTFDEHETIRRLCEGRNMCHVQMDQLFQKNTTECVNLNVPLKLEYKCLPDPDSASFEAICADTYMDVKCDNQIKGKALVIITARLEKQINTHLSNQRSTNGCPPLPLDHSGGSTCSSRIDVTQHIQSACDGRASCSVSPSMMDTRPELPKTCGKMHLSLTYVCVPSEMIVPSKRGEDETSLEAGSRTSGKGKKNQRQPKGVYAPKALATRGQKGTPRSDEPNLRDTRQLEHSSITNPALIQPDPEPNPTHSEVKSASPLSTNHIFTAAGTNTLQPLFIALGVGLIILILALAFVIAACRRKTRSTARCKRQVGVGQTIQHTCNQSDSTWMKPIQPGSTGAWCRMGSKETCSGCHAYNEQSPQSPTKITTVCGANPNEICRCSSANGAVLENSGNGAFGGTAAAELEEHFHPCRNLTATCSGHSPKHRLALNSYGLPRMHVPSENYPVSMNNVQYLVGLHSTDMPKSVMAYNDQHSMSQSNSSSSGVGVNSAHLTVYGSSYPMGPVLSSPPQPGTRMDSAAYSTGHKESPIAESSSGRGCDGGSGTSEPSEAFHFTCPRPKPGFHPIGNPLGTRSGGDYLPIPGPMAHMNASDYVKRVPTLHGTGSPYDAASARSLASAMSRPSRSDMSPRPSFRSSTSTEQNFSTPLGYLPKTGDITAGLDYVMEQPNLCEPYDHVGGYRLQESELCSQITLNRRPSQCDRYGLLPSAERDSEGETRKSTTMQQGSTESLTIPLLEPPSNFRSPTKVLNAGVNQEYIGLDPDDSPSSRTSNQKPPDVILKGTVPSSRSAENVCDDIEQPPPPIAPLRVFGNSNFTGLTKDPCYFDVR